MDLPSLQVSAIPPIMAQIQFASLLGVSKDTVRGWVENRTVPVVKVGKQRFINVHALMRDLESDKSIFVKGDYDE